MKYFLICLMLVLVSMHKGYAKDNEGQSVITLRIVEFGWVSYESNMPCNEFTGIMEQMHYKYTGANIPYRVFIVKTKQSYGIKRVITLVSIA